MYNLSSLLHTFDPNFCLLIKAHTDIFTFLFGGLGAGHKKKGEQERDKKMTSSRNRFWDYSLHWCFSNPKVYVNHPGSCSHTDSDSVGLGLRRGKLRFCLFNKFYSNSDAVDLWKTLISKAVIPCN